MWKRAKETIDKRDFAKCNWVEIIFFRKPNLKRVPQTKAKMVVAETREQHVIFYIFLEYVLAPLEPFVLVVRIIFKHWLTWRSSLATILLGC